ncbi:MAG: hypothetical protein EBR28_00080 [Planctomycetia bacterium]|nr:hypothetical protein [Planctomycetia bacterium]
MFRQMAGDAPKPCSHAYGPRSTCQSGAPACESASTRRLSFVAHSQNTPSSLAATVPEAELFCAWCGSIGPANSRCQRRLPSAASWHVRNRFPEGSSAEAA